MYWLPGILILPYFFLMLKIYRDLLRIRPYSPKPDPSVFISVIIACRNEQERLPVILECIARQYYPKELFEVIIVDDNSIDNTYEAAVGNKCSPGLTVIKNRGKGKKQAIKTGIDTASGQLIITTDADCTMGPGWINTIASFFEEHRPDMIIAPVQIRVSGKFWSIFQELEYLGLQGVTAGTAVAGNPVMCNGGNLAFTREAYLRNSENLHPELVSGDDVFLLHSVKKEPASKILWLESPEAIVTTSASAAAGSFLRQRKRWLSKWRFYDDRYTNLTGIITFSAVLLQLTVLITLLADFTFIWLFGAIMILKSVPDFLIIRNTAARYSQKLASLWLLPAEIIYPVYVIAVFLSTLLPWQEGKD
jgi:cellulose synthase/poly-beta-1,6-N-acetylglucosamine synthase-like glycosyltransferase